MIDLLGHFAYALIIAGTFFIGKKKAIGWLLKITGDLIWLSIGIAIGLSSVWFWETIFIIQSGYFLRQWCLDDQS